MSKVVWFGIGFLVSFKYTSKPAEPINFVELSSQTIWIYLSGLSRFTRVDHGPERKPQSPESAKEAVNHQDDEEAGKATTALFTEEERRVIEAPFQTIIFLLWSLHDGTNGVLRRAKCSVE